MLSELLLYFELLLFVAGLLLYGFLTRQLVRRPEVLAGNRPLRATLVTLTLWYGGTLLDQVLYFLHGEAEASWFATAVDLVRGLAWLLTLSLLLHTLERIEALAVRPGRPSPGRPLVVVGYLSLALFAVPAWDFARTASPYLAAAAAAVYPRIVLHAAVTLLPAAWLCRRLAAGVEGRRLASFCRALGGLLVALFALLAAGLWLDPWAPDAGGPARALRTLILGGLLLPGGLFILHVQRHNLLRLSLSNRALRHFLAVLLLALLVMAAGPALGLSDVHVLRRVVAWGLLLALALGAGSVPVLDWAAARSPKVRSLLGRSVTPRDVDRLMESLQGLELAEAAMLARTADALGGWLGASAAFLPPAADAPALAPLWEHFEGSEEAVVHRLRPLPGPLAAALASAGLHAAFALRVDGRMRGVLGLAASALGGGYADGEIEAVRMVLRQLAGILALRELAAARIAEERRMGETERLSMLGLVSASLAHEIKNPLSSMKALAQALREDLAARADGATVGGERNGEGIADLDAIVDQIDRLHATTREILGFARPRDADRTDLARLARSALYVLAAEAKKRGVAIAGAIDDEVDDGLEGDGTWPGSPAAWQTVVFNLVLNAVERTPAGATVRVSLAARDAGVELVVENPGEAPPAAVRERLFEPFVSAGGTGLGLALVARRVGELGGTVAVETEPDTATAGGAGERVRFRVRVPGTATAGGEGAAT